MVLAGSVVLSYGGNRALAKDRFPKSGHANDGAASASPGAAPAYQKDPKQIAYEEWRREWSALIGRPYSQTAYLGQHLAGRRGTK